MAGKRRFNLCVVGATGLVGKEIVSILEDREFPVRSLRLFASQRSAGEKMEFRGEELTVEPLEDASFEGMDIGLFSPGASVSKVYAPKAVSQGCVVIDNTSRFRMEPDVPLVVPEVNPHRIGDYKNRGIIANPNCSTIQMVVALKPIHERFRIRRVVVSTYQSVSGAGKAAMDELSDQVRMLFNMRGFECRVFPHQIAFNCIPHIDVFLENDYTKEEMKMVMETKKIMEDDSIRVTATCVRVPVFVGHSEAINIETEEPLTADEVRDILKDAPGVEVVDDPQGALYPMPVDCSERDEVFVGRIREDDTVENGINLWVVSDNLRKGAALNAVQIAELLIKEYL